MRSPAQARDRLSPRDAHTRGELYRIDRLFRLNVCARQGWPLEITGVFADGGEKVDNRFVVLQIFTT